MNVKDINSITLNFFLKSKDNDANFEKHYEENQIFIYSIQNLNLTFY